MIWTGMLWNGIEQLKSLHGREWVRTIYFGSAVCFESFRRGMALIMPIILEPVRDAFPYFDLGQIYLNQHPPPWPFLIAGNHGCRMIGWWLLFNKESFLWGGCDWNGWKRGVWEEKYIVWKSCLWRQIGKWWTMTKLSVPFPHAASLIPVTSWSYKRRRKKGFRGGMACFVRVKFIFLA